MQQFNLFDRSLLPPPPDWLMRGALALVGIGLLAAALHGAYERRALAQLMAAPGSESEATPEAEDAELRELTDRVARRSALRQSYRRSGGGLEHVGDTLAGIAAALPEDMWLKEVELGAERSLRVSGQVLQAASLQVFAARLQQAPGVKGVPLHSLAVERVEPESDNDPTPARLRFVIQAGTPHAEVQP